LEWQEPIKRKKIWLHVAQQLKTSEIIILAGVVFRGLMVCLAPIRLRFNFAEFATSEDIRKISD